jgi:AcrR family transcriptional regulator
MSSERSGRGRSGAVTGREGRAAEREARAAEREARARERGARTGERTGRRRHLLAEREQRAASGGGIDPIWTRPEPGRRRASHSREQIAAAAIAIADAEGLEAVSMRRVARELGAGTMTLYHYVRTKDDLLALMDDAIMGEVLVAPGKLPADWRAALTAIAGHSRAAFQRHPWAFDGLRNSRGGPNSLRHFEQSLGAVAGLGLDVAAQLELLTLVDDYVFGFVMREQQLTDFDVEEELRPAVLAFVEEQIATGEFPHIERFMSEDEESLGGFARFAAMARDPGRFQRGLERLLDGVEVTLSAD